MAASKPVFVYFPFEGPRAGPIRDAFKIGKIDFEDVRVPPQEFQTTHKATAPFGAVPTLKIGEKIISQNNSILRYVGKQTGLYPTDGYHALLADEICDAVEDFVSFILGPTMRVDNEKKKEMRVEIANKSGPQWFGQVEKVLERNGCSKEHVFVTGSDKMSVGDLKLYHLIAWLKSGMLDHIPTTISDAYPHITAIYAAVDAERAKHNIK